MKEEGKYPSDEELALFIESLETEELYAPRHLKEEILLKAEVCSKAELFAEAEAGMEESGEMPGSAEERTVRGKGQRPVSFLTYTVKMVAGMAAALLLTFVIPMRDGSELSYAQERTRRMQERMEEEQKEHEERLLRQQQRKSVDEIVTEYMNEKRLQADRQRSGLSEKIAGFMER